MVETKFVGDKNRPREKIAECVKVELPTSRPVKLCGFFVRPGRGYLRTERQTETREETLAHSAGTFPDFRADIENTRRYTTADTRDGPVGKMKAQNGRRRSFGFSFKRDNAFGDKIQKNNNDVHARSNSAKMIRRAFLSRKRKTNAVIKIVYTRQYETTGTNILYGRRCTTTKFLIVAGVWAIFFFLSC